jgi:hypothetical protein
MKCAAQSWQNLTPSSGFLLPRRLRLGLRKRRRYQSPINGAFETNRSLIPRRKRLGYGKVISNWVTTHNPWWFASAATKEWQQLADFSHLNGLLPRISCIISEIRQTVSFDR